MQCTQPHTHMHTHTPKRLRIVIIGPGQFDGWDFFISTVAARKKNAGKKIIYPRLFLANLAHLAKTPFGRFLSAGTKDSRVGHFRYFLILSTVKK